MIGVKPCYKYNVYTNFNPKYKDGKNKIYLEYFLSNASLYVYICMCVYVCICAYIVYICMCIYIYIYTAIQSMVINHHNKGCDCRKALLNGHHEGQYI